MVILGLLLIGAGAIAILSALFVSDGRGELLGIDMPTLAVFLVGVGAGVAILWGYTILKLGAKRDMRARRERKELNELSAKLERADEERKRDDEPQA